MDEPGSRRTLAGGRSSSLDRRATGVGLLGIAAFQVALAVGAPWGRAAYGGGHPGVLPDRLRVVSAGAALLYAGLAGAVVRERTPEPLRRRVLTGVVGLMGVGAAVNAISPSWPERAIWTPTTALLARSAWRARRGA